jgi:hypothetical protein
MGWPYPRRDCILHQIRQRRGTKTVLVHSCSSFPAQDHTIVPKHSHWLWNCSGPFLFLLLPLSLFLCKPRLYSSSSASAIGCETVLDHSYFFSFSSSTYSIFCTFLFLLLLLSISPSSPPSPPFLPSLSSPYIPTPSPSPFHLFFFNHNQKFEHCSGPIFLLHLLHFLYLLLLLLLYLILLRLLLTYSFSTTTILAKELFWTQSSFSS